MNKSTTYVVKIKICGEDRYFLSDRVIGGLVLNKEEAFHFGKLENAEKKRLIAEKMTAEEKK